MCLLLKETLMITHKDIKAEFMVYCSLILNYDPIMLNNDTKHKDDPEQLKMAKKGCN